MMVQGARTVHVLRHISRCGRNAALARRSGAQSLLGSVFVLGASPRGPWSEKLFFRRPRGRRQEPRCTLHARSDVRETQHQSGRIPHRRARPGALASRVAHDDAHSEFAEGFEPGRLRRVRGGHVEKPCQLVLESNLRRRASFRAEVSHGPGHETLFELGVTCFVCRNALQRTACPCMRAFCKSMTRHQRCEGFAAATLFRRGAHDVGDFVTEWKLTQRQRARPAWLTEGRRERETQARVLDLIERRAMRAFDELRRCTDGGAALAKSERTCHRGMFELRATALGSAAGTGATPGSGSAAGAGALGAGASGATGGLSALQPSARPAARAPQSWLRKAVVIAVVEQRFTPGGSGLLPCSRARTRRTRAPPAARTPRRRTSGTRSHRLRCAQSTR